MPFFFFFNVARNDLNLSFLSLPTGSFALCCLVILGALRCPWGKWFQLSNLPCENQRGQFFNVENVLTSENQKVDSIWNDTQSLNHGEPLWRDPIKPCVHIFSIWVNEALPNSYFINNFRVLVALRTHYILYGSWVMTEIAIAWHLVRHWFFLEPIRSSSATREVYSNDTY